MAVQSLTSALSELVLLEDRLTHRRIGSRDAALSERAVEIAYRSISHVVYSSSSVFATGYLQFVIPGVNEECTGRFRATSDPNTFFFEHALTAQVVRAKEYVERRIQEIPREVREAEATARLDLAGERIEGVDQELSIFADRLAIAPLGIMGLLMKGRTRTLAYDSITAIEHRDAGALPGYLRFSVPGGVEARRTLGMTAGAENSFTFAADQNSAVRRVKAYVERRIAELQREHA